MAVSEGTRAPEPLPRQLEVGDPVVEHLPELEEQEVPQTDPHQCEDVSVLSAHPSLVRNPAPVPGVPVRRGRG